MNSKQFILGLLVFSVAGLLTLPADRAVAASGATLKGEKVCVPPELAQKMMACEGGIGFDQASRRSAQIGLSTVKKDLTPKKTVEGPSLDRQLVRDILEGSFTQKRQARTLDILKQEIELITRLVRGTPDSDPDKAEILKRLADAYKEMYTAINFMARGMDESIFQARQAGDTKKMNQMRAQQKALDDRATQIREAAIKAYVRIRDGFQNYDGYDQILFAIAYEIDQMATEVRDDAIKSAYRQRARQYYQELIRNFPESEYIPHAWMAFAEYYFHEERNVTQAMKAYQQVVDWGEANNANYVIAMYYQAWCLINMQEHKKAIMQFTRVIEYAQKNPDSKEANAVARRSRMELVAPFSEIGNPGDGWKTFQKVGGEQSHAMLERLATIYYDGGRWLDAIVVFQQLQKLEVDNYRKNNGADICKYQVFITRASIATYPKARQVEEISRQIALSKKFATEGHDPKVKDRCNQETISIAWDIATQWHLEAVGSDTAPGTKSKETMDLCIALYDEILKNYPDLDQLVVEGFNEQTKPSRYRVAYYKAELYWMMEDWERCGPAFDYVVDLDPKGEYTSDSAYAAVLCYNKVYVQRRADSDRERRHAVQATDEDVEKKCTAQCRKQKADTRDECMATCRKENRPVLERVALTELEEGILNSYHRYICFVDKADDLVNIKYRRARIYYEANMFPEAAVLFRDIAVNHSDDEVGVYAANLYLDSLNAIGSLIKEPILACYDDLAAVVDVFIDTSKKPGSDLMKDEQFAAQIKSLKVGVMRKQAESLTERRRFMESAEIYLDIYRNYKGVYDDRGMCEVLFNSAINLESARLVMKAIDVRDHMVKQFPDCEHSKRAAYYIGQNYHALQNFSRAAEYYVRFATQYSGEPEAKEAMANAVVFYIGLNQIADAMKTVAQFEKTYGSRDTQRTASVVFGAGFVYFNEKKWDETRKWYTDYLRKYSKAKHFDEQIQANVMIGDTFWHRNDFSGAARYYRNAITLWDRNEKAITENARRAAAMIATAKSRYQLAEIKFQEFERIKFPEFVAQRGIPKNIEKWWGEKRKERFTPEQIAEIDEWGRQRTRLARWGYYEEGKSVKEQIAMVRKEERREELNIQFEYWAERSLGPWFERKIKAMTEAAEAFGAVARMHVPEWEMAAAARAADMQLSFMRDIYDSPLPPAMEGDQELIDIYRGAMDERAAPYRDGAVAAYEHCLNISTKVRWFNENSLRCEKELNQLEPLKYPISEEIRVTPKTEFEFYAPPEPVLRIETEAERREREIIQSESESVSDGAE